MDDTNISSLPNTFEYAALGPSRSINYEFRVDISDLSLEDLKGKNLKIVKEAINILNSPEFIKLKSAYVKNEHTAVKIGNRVVKFEPDFPCDGTHYGLSNFGENEFYLFCSAFENKMELVKTILHELFRLHSSKLKGYGNSKNTVKTETYDSFKFSEDIYNKLFLN